MPATDTPSPIFAAEEIDIAVMIEAARLDVAAAPPVYRPGDFWDELIDVNLEESTFHNRGVPHLQAARQLLEHVGARIKGLMQKWVREGGSIEHFNLEDAKKWEDVTRFQRENEETLNASPENLIRQFFTRGKTKIERIIADTSSHDTLSIEFMLELIFLVSGVAKEILGFKSHIVIKVAEKAGKEA